MENEASKFVQKSAEIAFDKKHRRVIGFNMAKYDAAVAKGMSKYASLETAKQNAAAIKRNVINHLDTYLLEFEKNISKRGVEVIWAENQQQALEAIERILKECDAKSIVKSKSMTTEEIELNHFVEQIGIEVVETDLGEFIVQQAGEKPYHIVTPAMHKSKEDVAELFTKKFNTPEGSSPQFIAGYVRKLLREKFLNADVGITGANFLIADTGSVVVTENEGNASLSYSMPKVHIAIAGIEKIIPRFTDLQLFLPLLAVHGTGQSITAYNSIISGARQVGEVDGAQKMYVILLDNGRSELLSKEVQKEALTCIRCGACLNACPVYKNIGGYTYSTTYTGPIGSIISPHYTGMQQFGHLSFASTLCGKCKEVCPVKIDIPRMLLYNRKEMTDRKLTKKTERMIVSIAKHVLNDRKLMDFGNVGFKNYVLKKVLARLWGKKRQFPDLKTSFGKQYMNGTL